MTPIDFQIQSLGGFRQVEIIKEKIINLSQSDLEAGLPPILESNNYHDVFSALGLAVFQNLPPGSDLQRQLPIAHEFFCGDFVFLEFLITNFKSSQKTQTQLRDPQPGPTDRIEKLFQQLRGSMYYGDTEAADDAVTKLCRTTSIFQIFEYIFELGIQDMSFGAKKAITSLQYWQLSSILRHSFTPLLLRSLVRYFCQSLNATPQADRHDVTSWIESESLADQTGDDWIYHLPSRQPDIQNLMHTIVDGPLLVALASVDEVLGKGYHPIWTWSAVFQLAISGCQLSDFKLSKDNTLLGVSSLFKISQLVHNPSLRLKAMFQAVAMVASRKGTCNGKFIYSNENITEFYNELQQKANGVSLTDCLQYYELISGLNNWFKYQSISVL